MINRGPVQKDSFFSAFTVGIKTELFEAGEALAVGDFVAVNYAADTSLTKVYKANSGTATLLVVGVALEAAAAGSNVRVQVKGPCEVAKVLTGVAAGTLVAKSAVGGRANAKSGATERAVAVTLTAAAANLASVVIL